MIHAKLNARLTPETQQRLQALEDRHHFNGAGNVNNLLTYLLDQAERPQTSHASEVSEISLAQLLDAIECKDKERQTIVEFLEASGIAWKAFVRDALVRKAERLEKRSQVLANMNTEGEDKPVRTRVKGSSYKLVHDTVQRLMRENTAATEVSQRLYLSKPLLQRITGVSPVTTLAYWRDYGHVIDSHNKSMGFATAESGRHHNQWVHGRDGVQDDKIVEGTAKVS